METNPTNLTDQKIISFLKWIFSIFFLFLALGALMQKSILASLILVLIAALLLPPFSGFWKTNFPFLKNRIIKAIIIFILFIISIAVYKDFDKISTIDEQKEKSELTTSKTEESKKGITLENSKSSQSLIGRYRNSEETSCNVTLDITKSQDGYSYKFKIADKLYKGKVSLNVDKEEKYITLEGIQWISNLGPLKEEDEPDKMESIPTYGIDLQWNENELEFQNYGNSANYYVITECEDKNVRLVKVPD